MSIEDGTEIDFQVRPSVEVQEEVAVGPPIPSELDSVASKAVSLRRRTLIDTWAPDVVPERTSRDHVLASADHHNDPVSGLG